MVWLQISSDKVAVTIGLGIANTFDVELLIIKSL